MALKKTNEISKILDALTDHYGQFQTYMEQEPLIDQLIFLIIKKDEKLEHAKEAFSSLKKEFVDWNELRVTHPREIADILKTFLKKEVTRKSYQLRDILAHVFIVCNRMDLQYLLEKEIGDVQKFFMQISSIHDDFVISVLAQSMKNPDLSFSPDFIRVGKRIGFWDENANPASMKKILGKDVTPNQLRRLQVYFFLHGERICLPSNYDCTICPILKFCEWGQKRVQPVLPKKEKIQTKKTKEPRKEAAQEVKAAKSAKPAKHAKLAAAPPAKEKKDKKSPETSRKVNTEKETRYSAGKIVKKNSKK